MQRLTVEAKSQGSAQGLYHALSAFDPDLTIDQGKFLVSIDLGEMEHTVRVLNVLQGFLDGRATARL